MPPSSAALAGGCAHLEMAEDVFQHHDRVVDEARQHQRHAAENHGVDRVPPMHSGPERLRCTRLGWRADGDRGAHVAEKQKDHEPGEAKADGALVDDVLDGGFDKHGLVEDNRGLELLRDVEQVLDGLPDAVDDGDGVGVAALLEHRNVDGVLSIDAHDIGLELAAILRIAYVRNHDRCIAYGLERKLVNRIGYGHLAICVNIVVLQGRCAHRQPAESDSTCSANRTTSMTP